VKVGPNSTGRVGALLEGGREVEPARTITGMMCAKHPGRHQPGGGPSGGASNTSRRRKSPRGEAEAGQSKGGNNANLSLRGARECDLAHRASSNFHASSWKGPPPRRA
jgi:hypothetical protein